MPESETFPGEMSCPRASRYQGYGGRGTRVVGRAGQKPEQKCAQFPGTILHERKGYATVLVFLVLCHFGGVAVDIW